jgi:hypothetical protein
MISSKLQLVPITQIQKGLKNFLYDLQWKKKKTKNITFTEKHTVPLSLKKNTHYQYTSSLLSGVRAPLSNITIPICTVLY